MVVGVCGNTDNRTRRRKPRESEQGHAQIHPHPTPPTHHTPSLLSCPRKGTASTAGGCTAMAARGEGGRGEKVKRRENKDKSQSPLTQCACNLAKKSRPFPPHLFTLFTLSASALLPHSPLPQYLGSLGRCRARGGEQTAGRRDGLVKTSEHNESRWKYFSIFCV